MRSLSPEEADLWARVAATIRPLSPENSSFAAVPKPVERGHKPAPIRLHDRSSRFGRGPAEGGHARPPGLADKTLDGGWEKKLRGGSVQPDRVLDLHGMNLDTAWAAIDRTLDQAIARGDRVILLITGHQRQGEPPVDRGRIRAVVHDWLAASRYARDIAAVRGAHRRHGGGGSLYLGLRRRPRSR